MKAFILLLALATCSQSNMPLAARRRSAVYCSRSLASHSSQLSAAHSGPVNSVDFCSTSDLVSASDDGTIRVWDVRTGTCLKTATVGNSGVRAAYCLPEHGLLVAGGNEWKSSHPGKEAKSTAVTKRLVSGFTQLWDRQLQRPRWSYHDHVGRLNSIAVSRDGSTLASTGDDRRILLRSLPSGRLQQELQTPGFDGLWSVLSPDGQTLIVGGVIYRKTKVDVTDNQGRRAAGRVTDPLGEIRCYSTNPVRMRRVIRTVQPESLARVFSFSPDGRTILGINGNHVLLRLDPAKMEVVLRMSGHSEWIDAAAFSPDGRMIASAADTELRIWNAHTGQPVKSRRCSGPVLSLAFSPDSRLLACGGGGAEGNGRGQVRYSGFLELWDLTNGKLRWSHKRVTRWTV